jgi:hypothetical protein
MVKKGTLASPAMARASRSCRCPAGRPAARPWDAAAQALEFLRVAQEVDDFLQVVLGLVHAGNVFERHAALALGQQLGARLAETHGLAAAGLHLAHEEPRRRSISSMGNQL